jgi:hypothetical protein
MRRSNRTPSAMGSCASTPSAAWNIRCSQARFRWLHTPNSILPKIGMNLGTPILLHICARPLGKREASGLNDSTDACTFWTSIGDFSSFLFFLLFSSTRMGAVTVFFHLA